jgi:hypothetical protein
MLREQIYLLKPLSCYHWQGLKILFLIRAHPPHPYYPCSIYLAQHNLPFHTNILQKMRIVRYQDQCALITINSSR